jgi:hypothetical protein
MNEEHLKKGDRVVLKRGFCASPLAHEIVEERGKDGAHPPHAVTACSLQACFSRTYPNHYYHELVTADTTCLWCTAGVDGYVRNEDYND